MSLLSRAVSGISNLVASAIGQRPSTKVTEITEKNLETYCSVLTLIVLHKYTHVKPAALPYLRVTAVAVLNKSVELDWN